MFHFQPGRSWATSVLDGAGRLCQNLNHPLEDVAESPLFFKALACTFGFHEASRLWTILRCLDLGFSGALAVGTRVPTGGGRVVDGAAPNASSQLPLAEGAYLAGRLALSICSHTGSMQRLDISVSCAEFREPNTYGLTVGSIKPFLSDTRQ